MMKKNKNESTKIKTYEKLLKTFRFFNGNMNNKLNKSLFNNTLTANNNNNNRLALLDGTK